MRMFVYVAVLAAAATLTVKGLKVMDLPTSNTELSQLDAISPPGLVELETKLV